MYSIKKYSVKVLVKTLAALSLLFIAHSLTAQQKDLKLWYNKPAKAWTDALPIGNGRLGAMIFAGADTDRIQFNENTLWTGGPRDYFRKGAKNYLDSIRQLIFAGKQKDAEAMAEAHFMGKKYGEDNYEALKAAWFKKVRGNLSPSTENFNDQNWKLIVQPMRNGWETAGLEGLDGAVWLRNTFEVPAAWKGKNIVLSLGRIRDMDYTFVNGKQVGHIEGTDYRKYVIPASLIHAGKNQIAIQVINYYDKGGLTSDAKELMIYPEGADVSAGSKLNTTWKFWVQDEDVPPMPRYNADYQPFGNIYLIAKDISNAANYRRELDISNAIAKTSFTCNGVNYTREYLSSNPDKAIAIHLTADQKGKINFEALLKTTQKAYVLKKVDDHTLSISFNVRNGILKGVSYLYAQSVNGKVNVTTNGIRITGADEATLYLVAATNFKNYKDVSGNPESVCKKAIAEVQAKSYAAVKTAHIADYLQYFNAFSIDLGTSQQAALPTDERIKQFNAKTDPALITLFMQYGRYLLISSSRPGMGPANLQGIWNDLLTPPWGSKFTTNVNLQMNYWPAEVLNLSALNEPLFKAINELEQTGKQTAKEHYNASGWVLHHNTDQWRGTAPVNAANHGIWVTGAAWLCHHLYEHYLFTRDKAFLKKEAYSQMKEAAEFFVDFLVKDLKSGYLISAPSNSPEHGGLVAGPTMDHQIIRDLFKNCIEASKILGIDEDFRKILQEKYSQIAPNKIGRAGQLQEWMEDKDDTADTHRHVSHMWGVYPGTDINWNDPAMMKAAKQSMLYRGDDGTGWSIAWKVNIWARMKDGDHAMLMLSKILSPADAVPNHEKGGVYRNMFDAHPPFQIDGNFGGAAGIAEMLVQSQTGAIELLPALPTALTEGEVKGICARGGFMLNFSWKGGKLQQLEVISTKGEKCMLSYAGKQIEVITQKGKAYSFSGDLKQL
jgi:alpha-L-fucosidase 2